MTSPQPQARFLMCRPAHFAVTYAINPWMDPEHWARNDHALGAAAWQEWSGLHQTLRDLGAAIELVPPVRGLPDLVFTANAAVVLDRTALLARFRHPERQPEEPHFDAAFRALQARGILDAVRTLPDGLVLEGAGDCVWDDARNLFWMGYGRRSDAHARHAVEATFAVGVVALELVDPRFYHLDTALSALPRGELMYFPGAFAAAARAAILERIDPADRIELTAEDACHLSARPGRHDRAAGLRSPAARRARAAGLLRARDGVGCVPAQRRRSFLPDAAARCTIPRGIPPRSVFATAATASAGKIVS